MSRVAFPSSVAVAIRGVDTLVLLAPKSAIVEKWHQTILPARALDLMEKALADAEPGDLGALVSTLTGEEHPRKVIVGVLPDRVSRHNSGSRAEYIFNCTSNAGIAEMSNVTVICHVDDESFVNACAMAVARALPRYTMKSRKLAKKAGRVQICIVDSRHRVQSGGKEMEALVESGRWAAELVDTPTADLNTSDFVRRARARLKGMRGIKATTIVGAKLLEQKLGGLHGVGRAAAVAPRLLILEYSPRPVGRKKQLTIGLVGKGVVYDTGGLNLKTGGSMSGMKGDMGGAAAVVGAFAALIAARCPHKLVCLTPLAENAIDKDSYRPDDILTMHSGKTVEINNTDAEGRLLLADGVSWVGRKRAPDLIIDAATLTGAQLVATGYRHAAIVTNRDGIEELAVASGRISGDLVHPIPFAPEFYQAEFKSLVADMKNSVKDRMNAQSSCAAQFVYSHIEDLNVPWLHIDLAGPATRNGRGSGFGVALITEIISKLEAKHLVS